MIDENGSGYGSGYGYGDGYGYGNGNGNGSGDGSGNSFGYGNGSGSGDGSGNGFGYGSGNGCGDGYADCSGYGYGNDSGCGSGYVYEDSSLTEKSRFIFIKKIWRILSMKWLKRIMEYHVDKQLAEKCGLEVKDICVHEYQNNLEFDSRPRYQKAAKPTCKKCGEFYK